MPQNTNRIMLRHCAMKRVSYFQVYLSHKLVDWRQVVCISPFFKVQSLRRLEQDNREAGERLEEVVQRGEALLEQIQSALADIAQSQLDMQHLQADGVGKSSVNIPP